MNNLVIIFYNALRKLGYNELQVEEENAWH